jgi:carboxypeptidase T
MRGYLIRLGGGLALWSVAVAASAHAKVGPVEVLRVQTRDEAVIRALAREHGHLKVDREKGVVIFDAPAGQRGALLAKGMRVTVDPVLSEAANARTGASLGVAKAIPGYACYRTVAESNARIQELATLYPNLVQVQDLGPSWEYVNTAGAGGERLLLMRLGNRSVPSPKPVMFAMTAIHAREYTTAELGLRFGEYLLENYGHDADATWILDTQEVQLLVQSNPDGRKQAQTGLSWRKNTNTGYCGATSNSRGADLNRNFPFAWNTVAGGSSGNPCEATYRGPSAGSEPETQAVVSHIRNTFADLRGDGMNDPAPDDLQGLFLDIHSYSELVLWPWGMTTTPAPNGPALEQLGRRFAWFNNYTPQQSVGLYPTDGTTDDTAYGELGVPAYTFELGTAFFQACATFESTVFPDNLKALIYAARVTRAPYRLPFGPEALQVRSEPDLPIVGEQVRVRAALDDSRSRGGSAQAVSSAAAYVGTPPWQAGAQAQPLVASDGSFGSSSENVEGVLAALPEGRQMVFVQGSDASGAAGPVGAVFVDVRAADAVSELSGLVRSRRDGGAVVGAQIEVGGFATTSGAGGAYSRRVPAEANSMSVRAPGFEPLEISGLSLPAGGALVRDVELYAYCPRLATDAEQGLQGWTSVRPSSAGALWAIVESGAVNSSRAWHDSPGGNYGNNLDTQLISPEFSMAGYSGAVLRLRSRCDTEAGYDFGQIEVRTGPGAAWTSVYSCSGDANWRDLQIALPQIEGATQAQIRLRLTSDTNVVRDGWYVDDLVLEAGGPTCRASQQTVEVFEDGFEASN